MLRWDVSPFKLRNCIMNGTGCCRYSLGRVEPTLVDLFSSDVCQSENSLRNSEILFVCKKNGCMRVIRHGVNLTAAYGRSV